MSTQQQLLLAAISSLEAQRAALGDAVVDAAVAPLRGRLDALAVAPTGAIAPEQTLKQVTVLFLDFVGSTRLSQHLDPEQIHAVMNDALIRCTGIVEAHHGKVLQYAGDNLLAVFGADEAQEDDPERAVHAGLALLQEGQRQRERVQQRHRRDGFDVRVGVHTGGVLLGGGIEAQGSIRGMAVNIAARMEQTAPAGALRISQETYRNVRGVFEVEPQPPLQVKGNDEALLTYLVRRVKPASDRVSGRGVDGIDTRMVGRDGELIRLQTLFDRAARECVLALVALVGDAGLGKSRLMSEFQQALGSRSSLIVSGQAQPHGLTHPYGVLRDILCRRCQIQDSDTDDQARHKLVAVVGATFGARCEEWSALIGQLIGLDCTASPHVAGILQDGKQIRDRAFHALARYFGGLCNDGALVLMLDDLHWADEGSLDFIAFLARHCQDRAMLLLCAARPALYERHPQWCEAVERAERIDLLPLTASGSDELAAVLLQRIQNPPPALRRLLTAGAEGNPFYMEELTQVLIDDGVIRTGDDGWTLAAPDRLPELRVPSTLTGVLQARLDALPRQEKESLQRASVIGPRFWQDALEQLQAGSARALPALLRKGLVRERAVSTFAGVDEYEFKHHLLHQVTYDGVLKRQRREWHRATAEWLVARSGDRAGEYLALIAAHFAGAGDDGRAATYWAKAAEDALARFAVDAALQHSDRALELIPVTDPRGRYAMVRVREGVHSRRASRETQDQTLSELEHLADLEGDDVKRCWVAIRRAGFEQRGGNYTQALALAEQALALSPRSPGLAARAHEMVATSLSRLDRREEARRHAEAGLTLARAGGDKCVEASLLNNGAVVLAESGDVSGAVALFAQALALYREVDDTFSVAITLSNLSEMSRTLGDFTGARAQAVETIHLARETGNRQIEGSAELNLALIVLNQGEPQTALDHALAALAIMREFGDRWSESGALTHAGHAELALGHWDAANKHYAAARELCDALGVGHLAMVAMGGLADVALATGDLVGARQQVHAVLERLAAGATLDSIEEPLRLRLTCYRVLAADKDPRAADLLASAYSELQALAAAVPDPRAQHALLHGVPHHREIMQAWEAAQPIRP